MYLCENLCDCLKRSPKVAYINQLHNSNSQWICLPSCRYLYTFCLKNFRKIDKYLFGRNMAVSTIPCTYEFSRGYSTGVAEALGNWGFSNKECSAGQELRRLKCLFAKMDSLRSNNKPTMCVKYDRRYDPDAWYVKPSPDKCKPVWTFPMKRPLITYNSTATIIKVSNLHDVGSDLTHVIPGRSYVQQGTTKWYRRGSDCCYQPSCLAPQCPVRYCCKS